jgi:hypothetical protein
VFPPSILTLTGLTRLHLSEGYHTEAPPAAGLVTIPDTITRLGLLEDLSMRCLLQEVGALCIPTVPSPWVTI